MARFITKEGYEAIRAEIDFLWKTERPRVVAEVSSAADLGDRSENAAYIYGKKRMREIDSRLRYLRRKIEAVTVVDLATQPQFSTIKFGAIVEVLDDDEETRVFRLVDKEESEPKRGRISVQSPIGRALLGREVGDYVTVRLPKGTAGLEIVSIRYGAGDP
ncbi:MAG: GreA/GreB family elongation factor [Myxococcota bacterium]